MSSHPIKLFFKRLLWPGPNLVGRDKKVVVRSFLRATPEKPIKTLDCGCGNAYFSYQAAIRGSQVTGLTIHEWEERNCTEMRDYMGIAPEQFEIRRQRVEAFQAEGGHDSQFDQVLLLDVLEHIRDDARALRVLNQLMVEDGLLYITVPNRDWQGSGVFLRVTRVEDGWHVRNGYTFEHLEQLLDQAGFEPVDRFRFGNVGTSLSLRLQEALPDSSKEFFSMLLLPIYRLLYFLFFWWSDPHTICVIARKRGQ